jgi:replicative DNA helicase
MSIELTGVEERAIIAMALDEPTFFSSIIDQIDSEFFTLDEAKYIFKIIKFCYDNNGDIPSRELVRDLTEKTLTTDIDNYREILEICDHKINPRDYDLIKERFINWLRARTLNNVYNDDIIESIKTGNYTELEKIIEKASRIQDLSGEYMWFFDDVSKIFQENIEIKYTTGFKELDVHINEGGPTKGDVMVWMAPTGVGKSIVICNNAAACVKMGLKVLHITCELSWYKTACRYCGIFSRVNIKNRFNHQDFIQKILGKVRKTYGGDLAIYEFPPDQISIRTITSLCDQLKKTRNWVPDVIAIDYLELLNSENPYFNQDEYKRQKKVSTEVRALAKMTQTYVITATQTNRADKNDKGEGLLDVNRVSESFGKMMPADYVVSINQSRIEYSSFNEKDKKSLDETDASGESEDQKNKKIIPAKMRLYIAKNRNGPKFKTVNTLINFNTMFMKEMSESEPDTE